MLWMPIPCSLELPVEGQGLPVLRTGGGQPLVKPDGLASVSVRFDQLGRDIDVGHAAKAQVRPLRASELGTDGRPVGRSNSVRERQCLTALQAAIRWSGRVGGAERTDK